MMLNLRNKRGVILIVAYFLIVVLLIFSVIFVNRTINERNIAIRQRNITMAFYLAEAGLDAGLNWLKGEENPPIAQTPLFGGPVALGGGSYQVSITPNPALNRYAINSTGIVADINRTLENQVQESSFASYAWFTDIERFRWQGRWRALWFMGTDTMEGPVRSNDLFAMMNNPEFSGSVSQTGNNMLFYNNGAIIGGASGVSSNWQDIDGDGVFDPDVDVGIDVPVYGGGDVTFGAAEINLPVDSPDLIAAAAADEFELKGPTTVVLNADGTMNVTNAAKGWDGTESMVIGPNRALYVGDGASLTISGTLKGRLTVGADRNIIIPNNITYTSKGSDSEDMLGLIARMNVIVDNDAPNDIEIDGSIMALRGSFIVEDWNREPAKGTLTVYGGIAQKYRGPVGMADLNGSKTSGYSRDYNYDPRLALASPPYFPVTGDYVSLSWRD